MHDTQFATAIAPAMEARAPQPTNPHATNRLGGQPMGGQPTNGQAPNGQPATAPATNGTANSEQEVYRVASELFRQTPDWVTFFREVLGVEGVIRRYYNTPAQLESFEASEEYAAIQQMVAKLRERSGAQTDDKEPTRVITVRLPKSLHESLRTEAHEKRTSMNKLCISKLLQVIDDQLIPHD